MDGDDEMSLFLFRLAFLPSFLHSFRPSILPHPFTAERELAYFAHFLFARR